MKLTAKNIWEALPVLYRIITEARPMPQAGKFRVSRMHTKLMPDFTVINNARDELIKKYDHHPLVVKDPQIRAMMARGMVMAENSDVEMVPSDEFAVPDDKLDEFNKAWEELGAEVIDINVQPIPIGMMSPVNADNGSIEAADISFLGVLVVDLSEVAAEGETTH